MGVDLEVLGMGIGWRGNVHLFLGHGVARQAGPGADPDARAERLPGGGCAQHLLAVIPPAFHIGQGLQGCSDRIDGCGPHFGVGCVDDGAPDQGV